MAEAAIALPVVMLAALFMVNASLAAYTAGVVMKAASYSARIAVPDREDRAGEFVVNIGTTHKGKRVADLPAQALVWFAEKMAATTSDAQATKDACTRFLAAHPEMRPHPELRSPAGGNGVKAPVPD